MSKNNQPEKPNGLNRRNFLGLAGAAAAVPLLTNPLSAGTSAPIHCDPKPPTPDECPECPVPNPSSASETWDEPWVWKPGKFQGESLQLNIVEHQTPSTAVGLGNPNAAIFSYNGATPGPTIRMKGDETLKVKIFNHLGLNQGDTVIGEAPDPAYYVKDKNKKPQGYNKSDFTFKEDWKLGEHLNGIHSIHTTNLHTHGLHVRPGMNIDGTHSDNIFLRVIPPEDLEKRESDYTYNGDFLLEGEQAGEAQFEFRLGQNNGHKIATHPPGTHWYHPHSHGSTNMEVASGMAGFLIVEGNLDETINEYMTGSKSINASLSTGKYGYRERLMMLQRVLIPPTDQDSARPELKQGATPATNGEPVTDTIVMRPGDLERWRLLNGSVDGKGYVRFMVLKGQWVNEVPPENAPFMGGTPRPTALPGIVDQLNSVKQLLYVNEDGQRQLPSTATIEEAKQSLHLLAQDGVGLVREKGDSAEYYLKDLKNDQKNPLYQDYSNLAGCYESAENLMACYNLSNELYMAPANRADFIFRAPELTSSQDYQIYTIIAKGTAIHTEHEQRELQLFNKYTDPNDPEANCFLGNFSVPGDTIMAHIIVRNPAPENPKKPKPYPVPQFDFKDFGAAINKVALPQYLTPITREEVRVQENDEDATPEKVGKYRARKVVYSGWGAATWPNMYVKEMRPFVPKKPLGKPNKYMVYDPTKYKIPDDYHKGDLMLPPATRTMAIDGKKFNPDDHHSPMPLLGTAEEWVVSNDSISLFAKFPEIPTSPKMTNAEKNFYVDHRVGYPLTRSEADEQEFDITTQGIDHPFHIHTNPFWLMRIEVPDKDGNLVNVLPEPRWHDVMWVPRNCGRIVFRSRFPDFVGKMVNHCHILQHEDNGMMQQVTITQSLKKTNYKPTSNIYNEEQPDSISQLGGIYEPDTLDDAYRICSRVIDTNHMKIDGVDFSYEFPAANGAFDPPKLGKKKKR